MQSLPKTQDQGEIEIISAAHTMANNLSLPQCSGGPAPCELCTKFATHCHFNPKLDTRRKASYKSSEKHDIRRYILESILQVLRHGTAEEVENLVGTMRTDTAIEEVARCFQHNFSLLQNKGVIPPFKIDESDIISLALQGVFLYRVGYVQGGNETETEIEPETVHAPPPSPSEHIHHHPDRSTDPYSMNSGQRPPQIRDFARKSPVSAVPNSTATLPSTSFNTAYSSFSDESFDFPPTPIPHSPQFYFDGTVAAGTTTQPWHHLTPYSNNESAHHPTSQGNSYPQNMPAIVSNMQQNIQGISNWQAQMPLNTSRMSWQQNSHGPIISPGIPAQLVPHSEHIYGSWPT